MFVLQGIYVTKKNLTFSSVINNFQALSCLSLNFEKNHELDLKVLKELGISGN